MDKIYDAPNLLIASPSLQDPNFYKTVILLVEHNREGALGFIINKPSEYSLKDIMVKPKQAIPEFVPTWTGGPVGTQSGLILQPNGDSGDTVMVSSSEESLHELIDYYDAEQSRDSMLEGATFKERETKQPIYHSRFVVGYAGWSPSQLEQELRQGSWISLGMSTELVFNTPWQDMWEETINFLGIPPANLATAAQQHLN